jgi:hypothetical protein
MKNYQQSLLILLALLLTLFTTSAFTTAPADHTSITAPRACRLVIQDAGITSTGPVDDVNSYNGTNSDASLHMGMQKVSVIP